jgi:hypothetical protein
MSEVKETVKQLVRFFVHPKQTTTEDGRTQFVDTIYISVTNSKNDAPCLKAEPRHFAQFAEHWERFKKSEEYKIYSAAQEEGLLAYTPLDKLGITPATVANLKAAGVKSVEALLETDIDKVAHIRGVQSVFDKARALSGEVAAPVVEEVPEVPAAIVAPNTGGRPRKAA